MDILFVKKEGDFRLRCDWLDDLSVHFLPSSTHHHITNRIELNMSIIVGESNHFSKQRHFLLHLLLLHLPLKKHHFLFKLCRLCLCTIQIKVFMFVVFSQCDNLCVYRFVLIFKHLVLLFDIKQRLFVTVSAQHMI